MKEVTILITTRNDGEILEQCIRGCLKQNYPREKFGIFIVDDNSTDRTIAVLRKFQKRIKYKRLASRLGRIKSLNIGIKSLKSPYFIEFNADCVPGRGWLKNLMNGFTNPKVAAVKTNSLGEGISTVYKTSLVKKLGLFDEDYNEKGSGFRYDTDMSFKILDSGHDINFVSASFSHLHPQPRNLREKFKYAISRIRIHKFDSLLYRKHPERTKDFLDIKLGFIRNPAEDFKVATGLWISRGNLSLSSPQGITAIENKSILHEILIILLGLAYVFLVKFGRFYGSIRFRRLLV